jgi:hypothetical protein
MLYSPITLAQWVATTPVESPYVWSRTELASLVMDTLRLQKWIPDRDSLVRLDRDSNVLFSKIAQLGLPHTGHEIHTGGVGYPSYDLGWNPKSGHSAPGVFGLYSAYINSGNNFCFPTIPLTRIQFQAGGDNLQILQLDHLQRIGPSLSAGVKLNSITHNGFLQQSGSKIRNTDMYLIGSLRPGRHFMLVSLQFLGVDLGENGGVRPGSSLLAAGYNPLNLNIQLRNAGSKHQAEQWILENHWSWRVHQPYAPRLVHRLRKQTYRWKFRDENVGGNLDFYPDPSRLVDSTSSQDSLRWSVWTHSLGIEQYKASGIHWQYGLDFSLQDYFSGSTQRVPKDGLSNALRSDIGLMAYIRLESLHRGFWVDWRQGLYHSFLPLTSNLTLGWHAPNPGMNSDSTPRSGDQGRKRFLKSVQLEGFLDPPSYAQRWMSTNAVAWNLPELQSAQGLMLSSQWQPGQKTSHRWTLRMGIMRQLIGLGYRVGNSIPSPTNPLHPGFTMMNNRDAVAYVGLHTQGTLALSKQGRIQWAWRYHHLWQWANDREWVPLPWWACDDWFYVQKRTLAGWTWISGLALRYQTPFSAPYYRPELGMWTLGLPDTQGSQSNPTSGGYPVLDLLAGIKVQKTLLFVRWEHANMGWPSNIGQLTAGYPLGDRRIRFGLDWKFLD